MVKSANRVIQILKTVGSHPEGLAHSEIAETLEIPKSSLSALLVNLLDCEYLTIDNSTLFTLEASILRGNRVPRSVVSCINCFFLRFITKISWYGFTK